MQNTVAVAQRELQRHLGRCLLRLQQYERLLKLMVATMSIKGHPKDLEALQAKRIKEVSTLTLGGLLKEFSRDYLVDQEHEVGESSISENGDVYSFSMSFALSMHPEDHKQTVKALTELRDMRNDLVHKFIECFDIHEEAGCMDGIRHLEDCYARIDEHFNELSDWATAQDELRKEALSYIGSNEFASLLSRASVTNVESSKQTIVEWLRDAEETHEVDGWTLVDDAVGYLNRVHGPQRPSLYGSKSWRELLNTSGQFETRFEKGSPDERGRTLFRSRVRTVPTS